MEEQVSLPTQPAKDLEAYKALLALDQQEQTLKRKSGYFRAYLLSVLIPPIGVYYFLKFLFFAESKSANRKAAVMSLVLTAVSLLLSIWLMQLFFKQAIGENSQDLNVLKELITPANQKTLQQLLR